MHPPDVAQAMKNNLNSEKKLQNKTFAINELNRLIRSGTNDVFFDAMSISNKIRNNRDQLKI